MNPFNDPTGCTSTWTYTAFLIKDGSEDIPANDEALPAPYILFASATRIFTLDKWDEYGVKEA